ncbi:MAG TPA: hypothetical protein VMW86_09030 [Dehalococcoidales bacterium]|nr:hypothetical protein [Dehalococcoidales bacterium]
MKQMFDFDDALVVVGVLMASAGIWLIYKPAALIIVGILFVLLGLRGSRLRRKQ